MATHISQSDSSPNRMASTVNVVSLFAIVNVGATGAPTVAKSPDSAFTITRASAGTYNLTFPKGRNVWIDCSLFSAALTVLGWAITARDANAGTATIKTLAGTNAAVATDPASGDALHIEITVER